MMGALAYSFECVANWPWTWIHGRWGSKHRPDLGRQWRWHTGRRTLTLAWLYFTTAHKLKVTFNKNHSIMQSVIIMTERNVKHGTALSPQNMLTLYYWIMLKHFQDSIFVPSETIRRNISSTNTWNLYVHCYYHHDLSSMRERLIWTCLQKWMCRSWNQSRSHLLPVLNTSLCMNAGINSKTDLRSIVSKWSRSNASWRERSTCTTFFRQSLTSPVQVVLNSCSMSKWDNKFWDPWVEKRIYFHHTRKHWHRPMNTYKHTSLWTHTKNTCFWQRTWQAIYIVRGNEDEGVKFQPTFSSTSSKRLRYSFIVLNAVHKSRIWSWESSRE